MYGIGKIFDTKFGGLIFSLLAGVAYFIMVCYLIISGTPRGELLAFFFSPAIIAGAALVIIKTVKNLSEAEKYRSINLLLYAHVLLMLISVVFLIDLIIK